MKIKTWIKYEEGYLPPRCRKLRYREREEYVDIPLRETDKESVKLAFEDNSYSGKGKIYFFRGKLWSLVKRNRFLEEERGTKSALEDLMYGNEHCTSFHRYSFDRENYGRDTSRDAVLRAARKEMQGYLLIDGELYELCNEPRYAVITFGLGCNHGGTGLFVEYYYNPNIAKEDYFTALEGKQAVACANQTAAGRGDTKDVGKFQEMIVVHMPELVKLRPHRDHGDGNQLMKKMEGIISAAQDPLLAGLLCIVEAEKSIRENT